MRSCNVAVGGCSSIPAGWFSAAGHHCASCMSGCGGVAIWGVGGRRGVRVQCLGSSGPGWGYKLFKLTRALLAARRTCRRGVLT